jgi:hypothetical protein
MPAGIYLDWVILDLPRLVIVAPASAESPAVSYSSIV